MRGRLRRGDDDQGAVLVEFVMVSTILVVLLFGIVEFGFAWADRLTVQTSTRAGARGGAALGNDRSADYNVIAAVKSAMADVDASNIEYVIVYEATSADGEVPAACLGATPTSQPGKCNVYAMWRSAEKRKLLQRSLVPLKVDAARASYASLGAGVTWAVLDTGARRDHPHFAGDDGDDGTIIDVLDCTTDDASPVRVARAGDTDLTIYPSPQPESGREHWRIECLPRNEVTISSRCLIAKKEIPSVKHTCEDFAAINV